MKPCDWLFGLIDKVFCSIAFLSFAAIALPLAWLSWTFALDWLAAILLLSLAFVRDDPDAADLLNGMLLLDLAERMRRVA